VYTVKPLPKGLPGVAQLTPVQMPFYDQPLCSCHRQINKAAFASERAPMAPAMRSTRGTLSPTATSSVALTWRMTSCVRERGCCCRYSRSSGAASCLMIFCQTRRYGEDLRMRILMRRTERLYSSTKRAGFFHLSRKPDQQLSSALLASLLFFHSLIETNGIYRLHVGGA